MKIKNIEKCERPRERLICYGAEKLTDSELLAIMLGSGSKTESVIDLANRLVLEYGLKRLFDMSYDELKAIKGIKEAKASKLMSLFEISRRCQKKETRSKLSNAKEVFEYIKGRYCFKELEELSIIYVNRRCEVIRDSSYGNMSVGSVFIPVREIVIDALRARAYGIFMVHNHPSGNLMPSQADLDATIMLKQALLPIDVKLLDHLIIDNDNFFSLESDDILKIMR